MREAPLRAGVRILARIPVPRDGWLRTSPEPCSLLLARVEEGSAPQGHWFSPLLM